jgi:DNA-binding MarR family transcriptional regulator
MTSQKDTAQKDTAQKDTAQKDAARKDSGVRTIDDLLPYLMNRIVSRLNRNLEVRLRRRGLSFQHWRVLAVLAAADGRNIAELADCAVIPHSTLSRLLDRMERDRMVERRTAPFDSRLVEIWLTPEGRGIHADILPLAVDESARALAGLDGDTQAGLAAVLHRIMENVGLDRIDRIGARRGRPPGGARGSGAVRRDEAGRP